MDGKTRKASGRPAWMQVPFKGDDDSWISIGASRLIPLSQTEASSWLAGSASKNVWPAILILLGIYNMRPYIALLAGLAPLLTMAQSPSSIQGAPPAVAAKPSPQAPQSVPLLDSFLGRGWPGSKAEALSELALLPVIGTFGRALPSALEWKATSKSHIYQGFKAGNGLEFRLGDFQVSQLIAITDQVHVKHLWLGVATRDPKAE